MTRAILLASDTATFSRAQLVQLLDLAEKGVAGLVDAQTAAIA